MALPKIIHPTKKIKIPSLNVEADFEPFTTEDEKAIVLLGQNASIYDKARIQLEIIEKCCRSENINFHTLAVSEISYIFLQLRKISVSGGLELGMKCQKCGEEFPFTIDIDSIEFDPTNLKEDKILIDTSDGKYFLVYSQIRVDDLQYIGKAGEEYNDAAQVLRMLMRPDGNDIIELTPEEKIELFGQLDISSVQKIADYLNKCPQMAHHIEVICPECGEKIEGELRDFFI